MNPTTLARHLGVDPVTLRRWTARYAPYLSPGATPAKGKSRVFTQEDMRVLYFIATLRDSGTEFDDIEDRLRDMQADGWATLPELPIEWEAAEDTVPVGMAVARAGEMAQLAVLQSELNNARFALQNAEKRIQVLEVQLADKATVEAEKHQLELELAKAKGEAVQLRAQLDVVNRAYSVGRSDRPLSAINLVAAIAIPAIIITLVLVLIIIAVTVLIT